MDFIDCTYFLESLQQARFEARFGNEIREHAGAHGLGEVTLATLRQLETKDEAYGRLLFDALFPPEGPLRACYRRVVKRANERQQGLRFRLHLSPDLPDEMQDLAWERIFDPDRGVALARSPQTPFSRSPGAMAPAARPGRPRLLGAVAAPPDLRRQGLPPIDRPRVTRWLEDCFQRTLQGQVDSVLLAGAITPQVLRDRLQEPFQALHLIAHGLPGTLILQDDDGLAAAVDESVVADVFLGCPELRLTLLMACYGAVTEGCGPFQGLAGRLVQRGLPAVIAMRRQISMTATELFTEAFYASLAKTGQVDVAANRARMALFLDERTHDHWSDPVLFMVLPDGRPWQVPRRRWALLLLLFLLASRGPDVEPVAVANPAPSVPPITQPEPVAEEDSPAATPAEPGPAPVRKTAAPRNTTAPPRPDPPVQPDLQALEARMQEAEEYGRLGGSGNQEKRLEIYQPVVAGLPRGDLDPVLLRLAEEQVRQGHTANAADLYHRLLDAYLQASSPSSRRNDP